MSSASSSVDGLISGLNTTQLISALMQQEAAPQQQLKTQQSDEQNTLSIYQTLNTKLAAIGTAAQALNTASDWQVMKATSSSSNVSAAATTGATTGTLSFTVSSLAAAHTLASSGTVADSTTTSVITPGSSVTVNGQSITVGGTGTLTDLVNAINGNSAAKVTATAVQVGANAYRLQLTANTSGAAGIFTADLSNATGLGGGTTLVSKGTDASIHVGDANAGYDVTSSTNTFTGVLPGVTFTLLNKDTTPVTLSVSTDSSALSSKIQALVNAANDAIKYISSQSTYDATNKKAGPLLGDPMVSTLQSRIVDAVTTAVGGSTLGSDGAVGIKLGSDSTFSFDSSVFTNAYTTNPSAVQALFTNGATTDSGNGIAERLDAVAKGATDFTSGSITLAIQGKQSEIKSLTDQIADWDTRLAQRQQTLQQQFTSMEVALGQLKDQSNWLSGQIASLPTSGG